MFYYLYQITNHANGKIYVGVHKTKNINDDYMGSGKVIKQAIKKYGVARFSKEILEWFDSEQEMFEREKEIVTEDFLARKDVYNIRRGGSGGFDWINKTMPRVERLKRASNGGRIGVKTQMKERIGIHSQTQAEKIHFASLGGLASHKAALQEYGQATIIMVNNRKDVQEKRKQAFLMIKHQQGKRNSQFGTIWITNGSQARKIKRNDPIPEGWIRGRKQDAA